MLNSDHWPILQAAGIFKFMEVCVYLTDLAHQRKLQSNFFKQEEGLLKHTLALQPQEHLWWGPGIYGKILRPNVGPEMENPNHIWIDDK